MKKKSFGNNSGFGSSFGGGMSRRPGGHGSDTTNLEGVSDGLSLSTIARNIVIFGGVLAGFFGGLSWTLSDKFMIPQADGSIKEDKIFRSTIAIAIAMAICTVLGLSAKFFKNWKDIHQEDLKLIAEETQNLVKNPSHAEAKAISSCIDPLTGEIKKDELEYLTKRRLEQQSKRKSLQGS